MFLEKIQQVKSITNIRKVEASDVILELHENEEFNKDEGSFKKMEDSIKNGDEYFDLYDITYTVEDLNIRGYITVPRSIDFNNKNKTAVFLRGGNNNFGALTEMNIFSFYRMSSILPHMEYITFFTQYRGGASGQGCDEFGGEDIKDCLALFEIIKSIDFCDGDNIVLMGHSRGGMMCYQLLRENIHLKDKIIKNNLGIIKAIIIAGTSDYERHIFSGWRADWQEHHLEKKFFDINDKEEMNKRSVVTFYKEIKNIPILIIHGTIDDKVNPQDSIDIHNLLPQSRLIMYEGDNHQIIINRKEMKKEIGSFLRD